MGLMAKKVKKTRNNPGFVKICSFVDGEESCIFCDRPNTGHLLADLGKETSNTLKGVAISVCKHCEKQRTKNLATEMIPSLD